MSYRNDAYGAALAGSSCRLNEYSKSRAEQGDDRSTGLGLLHHQLPAAVVEREDARQVGQQEGGGGHPEQPALGPLQHLPGSFLTADAHVVGAQDPAPGLVQLQGQGGLHPPEEAQGMPESGPAGR